MGMISASFSLSGYIPVAKEILIISFNGKHRIGARSLRTSVGILLGPVALEFANDEIVLIISSVSAARSWLQPTADESAALQVI